MGSFLGGHVILGVSLSQVLLRMDAWAFQVLSGALDTQSFGNHELAVDFVQAIAFDLTNSADGLEADVLRKSIQESLICIAGPDVEMTSAEMLDRLRLFLQMRASTGLLKRFLAFHVFNVVWFQTGDSFRALAWTQNAFFQDMTNVERYCCRLVSTIWNSSNLSRPLDSSSALDLVERLGNRLTGA